MNEGIELLVYRHNAPTVLVDVLNGAISPKILDELGVGVGSFLINVNDPKIVDDPTLLDYRNVIRVSVDGTVRGAFYIRQKNTVVVDQGGHAAKMLSISGPGLLGWFSDAQVRPYGGLRSASMNDRYFNFGSMGGTEWYKAAEWPLATHFGRPYSAQVPWWPDAPTPDKWPKSAHIRARWIWGEAPVAGVVPEGTCYFRHTFTSTEQTDLVIYALGDDNLELFLDGELLGSFEWRSSSRSRDPIRKEVTIAPGDHVLSARVENLPRTTGGNPAGFIAAVYRVMPDGSEKAWRWTGDNTAPEETWRVRKYPAHEPAWTPGDIMLTLMAEATARGVRFPSWLTPTFTATTDSNGVAWSQESRIPWSFKVGEKLSSILEKFREFGLDSRIDPATMQFSIVPLRGVDRTQDPNSVTFEVGKNLRKATSNGESQVTNSLAIRTPDGWLSDEHAGSKTTYGAIEDTFESDVTKPVAEVIAENIFAHRSAPTEAAAYDVTDTHEKPWVDFGVGDWVLAPNEQGLRVPRRVMSISVEENNNGRPQYSLEFDTIWQTRDERLARAVSKTSGGGMGGSFAGVGGDVPGLGSPTVEVPSTGVYQEVPKAPTSVNVASAGSWDAKGVTAYSALTITWAPVTLTLDNEEIVTDNYQVYLRDTSVATNQFELYATVTGTTATIPGLTPGRAYEVKVVAVANSISSADSSIINHVAVGPTAPMAAPTPPQLSTARSIVTAKWNGNLTNGAPPVQFRYVYASVSLTQTGTYTRMGMSLSRGGGDIPLTGLTPNTTYWVKLTAVDGVGVESPASTPASILVKGIDLGSLESDVAAAIAAAKKVATDLETEFDDFYATDFTNLDLAFNDFYDSELPVLEGQIRGVSARGDNLITNGSAELGDLTNFDSMGLVVAPEIAPAGYPSAFKATAIATNPFAREAIAINPELDYVLSGVAIGKAGMHHYLAIQPFDIEGYPVQHFQSNRFPGIESTLAAPLNPGQTTITLTNGSAWPTVFQAGRYLAAWPYVNGLGQTFNLEDGYTRRVWGIANATRSGNVITLPTPWAGEALASGTTVTLQLSGGTYLYPANGISTEDNQYYEGTISGIGNGIYGEMTDQWWPGTASIKPGWLLNYQSRVAESPGFTGFRFANDTARQVAITAQNSANGRNRIFTSLSDATGTADSNGVPFILGDTWWKKDKLTAGGVVIGQWNFDGTAWRTTEFSHQVVASIDFNKGVFGELDGGYLKANSASIKSLFISDFQNLMDNPEPTRAGGWETISGVPLDASLYDLANKELILKLGQAEVYNANQVPVTPGDTFQLKVDVRSLSAVGNTGGIRILNQSGSMISSLDIAPTATKTTYTHQFTIPAGTTRIRFRYAVALTSGEVRITKIELRHMEQGELLVDGTVASRHMQANSIYGQHVVIGTVDNILPNGFGEAGAALGWASSLTWDTTQKPDNARGSFRSIKGQSSVLQAGVDFINVEPNSEYFIEIWTYADVPNSRMFVEFTNQNGAHAGLNRVPDGYTMGEDSWAAGVHPMSNALVLTEWRRYTSILTTDELTTKMRVGGLYFNYSTGTERNAQVWMLMRIRTRTGPELMVDGSVLARHVGAGQIDTPQLHAEAVTADIVKLRELTGEHMKFHSLTGDEMELGTLTVDHVNAAFGKDLVIEGNEQIILALGAANSAKGIAEGVGGVVEEMQTFYKFGNDGAEIVTPTSPYSLWLKNDGIAIMQGGKEGTAVSQWTSGQLLVNEFVGTTATLGNHQLAQVAGGTVMRSMV